MILLIGGVSRSGKSTLAKRLCRQAGMSYMPLDSLISTLESLYPGAGMRHMDDNRVFSRQLALFIAELSGHLEYEEMDFILDPYQLFPVDYMEILAERRLPIVYLGYPHLSAADKLRAIRGHQRAQDWSKDMPDSELLPILEQFIAESKLMHQQCREHGLPFFDSGTDFDAAIEQAFGYISARMALNNVPRINPRR